MGQVENVLGKYFFSSFFGLSRPGLAINEAKMMLFNFLSVFTIF